MSSFAPTGVPLKQIQRSQLHKPSVSEELEPLDMGSEGGVTSLLSWSNYFYSQYGILNALTAYNHSSQSFLGGEWSSINSSGFGKTGNPQLNKCFSIQNTSFLRYKCQYPFREKIEIFKVDKDDFSSFDTEKLMSLYFDLSQEEVLSEKDIELKKRGELSDEEIRQRLYKTCTCKLNNYNLIGKNLELYIHVPVNQKISKPQLNEVANRIYPLGTVQDRSDNHEVDTKLYNEFKHLTLDYNGFKNEVKNYKILESEKNPMLNVDKISNIQIKSKSNSKKQKMIKQNQKKMNQKKLNSFLQQKNNYDKLKENDFNLNEINKENLDKINMINQESIHDDSYDSLNEFDSRIRQDESKFGDKVNKHGNLINHFLKIAPDIHDDKLEALKKQIPIPMESLRQDKEWLLGFRIKFPDSYSINLSPIYRFIESFKLLGQYNCDWSKLELIEYLRQMFYEEKLINQQVTLVTNKNTIALNTNISDKREIKKIQKYKNILDHQLDQTLNQLSYDQDKCIQLMDSIQMFNWRYENSKRFDLSEDDLE